MDIKDLHPLAEVTRGGIVESQHFGAVAVVDPRGRLVVSYGNPDLVTFLRSSAKPFQALPFVEAGGVEHFQLTDRELAVMCASHSGTDEHVAAVSGMQAKIGVSEAHLQCGAHRPYDAPTATELIRRGEKWTPLRHNCSGKHTGMLAHAALRGAALETYLADDHPVQQAILQAFAEMCDLPPQAVVVGIDGCSAPNFAVPLRNAALAFARLADPDGLGEKRAAALRHIYRAMTSHPEMVGGPGVFDSEVMRVAGGTVLSKGGAEGFQALAVQTAAGALGIAFKVADGDAARIKDTDPNGRVRPLVALSLLRDLGALDERQLAELAPFDRRPLTNFRKLLIGELRACYRP